MSQRLPPRGPGGYFDVKLTAELINQVTKMPDKWIEMPEDPRMPDRTSKMPDGTYQMSYI
jgi:hypothetical protein